MLKFDPETHSYSVAGRRVLSVTQILELAGVIDYSRLPRDVREFSLARGSAVHLATQFDDEGILDEESVDPEIVGYLNAWRNFRSETGWESFRIEERQYHPAYGYAGTIDRVGAFQGGGLNVLDIKTGKAPGWVALQLAAYSCLAELLDTRPTFGRVSVELHGDGSYKVETYSVSDRRRHLSDFLACLRVIQLRGEKWI